MADKVRHEETNGECEEKLCRCGSRKVPYWAHDARGIPLAKVCSCCEDTVLAKYRPEVLTDSEYACDEQVEEDR